MLGFLHIGMDNSCTLRRLKVNQLSWMPLSFKAVSHATMPTNFIWLFDFLMSSRILNSTVSCSVLPRLPLTTTFSISSFLFESSCCARKAYPPCIFTACVKKLSLIESINLVDSLHTETSPFQQISVWLELSLMNRLCRSKPSFRFFKKRFSLSYSSSNGLSFIHCGLLVTVLPSVVSKCNLWLSL